jgi:16S rRNA (guanine527-N7)-methyltransferase
VTLPAEFPARVATYLDELDRWQQIGRLTAYSEQGARIQHLVLESLMLLAVVPDPASPVLDIGSGPGIPGLILKLARPDWDVTLVEATRRRANFLRHVIRQLGLQGVIVHGARAETLVSSDLVNRFATVTMRAVAAPEAAMRLAAPFLAPTGTLVVPLGPEAGSFEGHVREVTLPRTGELPWRRRFLIIRRADLDAGVPRGTERLGRAHDRSREPEGRRR